MSKAHRGSEFPIRRDFRRAAEDAYEGGIAVGGTKTDFSAGAIAKPRAANPAESSLSVTGANDIFLLSEADAKKSSKHRLQDAFGEVIK